MCPLFGPGLRSGADALHLEPRDGGQRPLELAVQERAASLASPVVGRSVAREVLASPAPAVRSRSELAARFGEEDAPFVVRLVSDLAAARQVPMTRPLVPAEALGAGAVDRWLVRIANARRLQHSRLELVGIFPNLPLGEGAGIRLDAARGEAHVTLAPGRVVLTTIAVARRKDTGESVVAKLEA